MKNYFINDGQYIARVQAIEEVALGVVVYIEAFKASSNSLVLRQELHFGSTKMESFFEAVSCRREEVSSIAGGRFCTIIVNNS
jgi:hypothetical protein